jgi:predicted alpha/beta superfamily hydrolase
MTLWHDYTSLHDNHTVTGDLKILRDLHSHQLNNHRDITVWLPPSYAEGGRFPVLYMHDGQNLFDAAQSNSGEWMVDETLSHLSQEGLDAIVVGISNMGERRFFEYNPYPVHFQIDGQDDIVPSGVPEKVGGGQGDEYIRFIIDTLKRLIDAEFRTLPGQETTGLAGSSLGGLISLYAILTHPDVFGFCGSFSPAFWFGNHGMQKTIHDLAAGRGKIYLDIGGREGETFSHLPERWRSLIGDLDHAYLVGVRALRDLLLKSGYEADRSLMYVEEPEGRHHETAWARRLPNALRFLLKN